MSILLTGGAGYIGSHTCVEMLNAGYDVIVVDNLNNSSVESLNRVEKITGKKPSKEAGEKITITEPFIVPKWHKVIFNGEEAYMSANYCMIQDYEEQ